MSKTVLGPSQFGGQGLFCSVAVESAFREVLFEVPHVACVTEKRLKTTCCFCWSKSDKLLRCAKCKNAFFCSQACQKAAWVAHLHKGECTVVPDRTEDSVRLVLRFLLRGEPSRPLGDVALLLDEDQRRHTTELAAVLAVRLQTAGFTKFEENAISKALFQL